MIPEYKENEANLQDISVLFSPDVLAIGREARQDPTLRKIINQLEDSPETLSHFSISHNQLRYKG